MRCLSPSRPATPGRTLPSAATKRTNLYVETIEFGPVRYIETCENYAIYRYLYAGESEPNLPTSVLDGNLNSLEDGP